MLENQAKSQRCEPRGQDGDVGPLEVYPELAGSTISLGPYQGGQIEETVVIPDPCGLRDVDCPQDMEFLDLSLFGDSSS